MSIKLLYTIAFIVLIIFNIANINYGDLRFFGIIALVILFSILALIRNNLNSVVILISAIIILDFVIRIIIDKIWNYTTLTDQGEVISFKIKIFSQLSILIVSTIITLIIGRIWHLIKSRKN